jgi:hypothetical protein
VAKLIASTLQVVFRFETLARIREAFTSVKWGGEIDQIAAGIAWVLDSKAPASPTSMETISFTFFIDSTRPCARRL